MKPKKLPKVDHNGYQQKRHKGNSDYPFVFGDDKIRGVIYDKVQKK